jgi:FKBP-type peptidyl-prolyl cis-trans isomerase FklB
MKKTFFTAVFALTAAVSLFADGTNNVFLSDDKSRLSYAIGMYWASSWKEKGVDVDNNLVLRGLDDQQAGRPTLMSQQEAHDIINKLQNELADREKKMSDAIQARNLADAPKNKAEGEAFLAANKNNPGVKVMPAAGIDGKTYELQYKIITEGTGETPSPTDMVVVNYRATFITGTEFDSSAKRGQPAQFPVNHVIRGLSEALTHMKVGSKWQLFIPSELAYGPKGYGSIEPNITLIFEVELLSVQHPQQPAPAVAPQPLTSDIIKVQGTNIEVMKPEEVQKLQQSQSGK